MSDRFDNQPTVAVSDELIEQLVFLGGFTHPLFTDQSRNARPLPGQGVLLLVGGLVEQSGLLDDAVALLEMRHVRFHRMVLAGARLRVEILRGAQRSTSSGKLVVEFTWTALDADGIVVSAEVVMLMNQPGDS